MSVAELRMDGAALGIVVEHCRRELPNEACGILGGRDGRIESVHPVISVNPSPSRFAMDPAGQFRALDEISRSGHEVVGIYHSHPGGPAAPSSVDLEAACWPGTMVPNYPGAIQLIVSLQHADDPVVKGYATTAGAFVEVPVILNNGPVAEKPGTRKLLKKVPLHGLR